MFVACAICPRKQSGDQQLLVMAALEAAIHLASSRANESFAPVNTGAMDGRVKPGHDDVERWI
jgi:hypothetical protein